MRRDPLIHAAVLAGLLAVTGCKGEPARPHTPAAPAGEPAHTLVTHDVFRVDLAPLAACTAGTSCEARLVLHALGGYKVNAEYPTKFVGDVAAPRFVNPGAFGHDKRHRAELVDTAQLHDMAVLRYRLTR